MLVCCRGDVPVITLLNVTVHWTNCKEMWQIFLQLEWQRNGWNYIKN